VERPGDQDLRSQNISTATSPRGPIHTKAERNVGAATYSSGSRARSPNWGIADGYFVDEETAEIFYDELTWLCLNQHGAFNSPVWFNLSDCIINTARGKDGGAGNYFYNREDRQSRTRAIAIRVPRRAVPASSRACATRWKTSCDGQERGDAFQVR